MNIGKLKTSSKDITGLTFSKLTVVKITDYRTKSGAIKWLCRCECGTEKIVTGSDLSKGSVKSCGCLSRGLSKERGSYLKGDKNPSWKGGKKNRGSIAWANYRLGQAKCNLNGVSRDVTPEEYLKLINSSKGICAICGISEEEAGYNHCVDHDHSSGKLRGVLCKSCNTGIGVFTDSIEKLEKAIIYLKNEHR